VSLQSLPNWCTPTKWRGAVLKSHSDRVLSVAGSPDGRRLATASLDNTARVWDAQTGAEIAVLKGHSDPVWRVAWSPDGRRLATASWDNTARVWDAQTGA
jgi:WD40 repeat protein